MVVVTICSDFGALKNKICHCFHFFPIFLPWSDGTRSMILVFWMLSFKPAFSRFSFTFIKRLFSSSSLSVIRVVSSAYLKLLIFLLEIFIPACASSSPALCMMYSVQFTSVSQSCPTLCDPVNRSMPGLPVHYHLPEFTQTHVHRVSDAIRPSHPLSSPFPPAPNPSQHQSLFQWVNSSHEVAKVLEFQL